MKATLNFKTYNILAYIDGSPIFEDCSDILLDIAGTNNTGKIEVSNTPIDGYTKAMSIGHVGNTTQFHSKDGTFTVCNTFLLKYQMGKKQFYYKVNRL